MGKSKSKKSKQAAESSSVAVDGDGTVESPGQVNAIDGHNTSGWTDGEIRAYNDLIVERQRLEKQRNELEEKCAKSQTQRALLHENIASIDGMFKPQKATSGLLKYTGSSVCCVDLDLNLTKCHHDLCRRAKGEGISDTELDTIKYYAMRMYAEKSDRVRNALRKQRDVELDRVKKEEQEEQSQNARRSSRRPKPTHGDIQKSGGRGSRGKEVTKAAKETEKIVNKIINQLDDLRTDLQAGRISAEEAQGKLDLLDRNLPLGHGRPSRSKSAHDGESGLSSQDIDLTKQTLQTDLRDKLLGAKGDTFSQAFSIMDHFLSATKPGDLQDAISELKDVLQLAGPMCDDLQKSLGALEGIFDNPERLAFTGPDGKQECSSSIIELMGKLKDNLKRTGQLPDGANASLTKVFQDCIDLEEDAKTRMVKEASSLTLSTGELQKVLSGIKDECVAKSPIPPLTLTKLDSDMSALLDIHDAHRLLNKTRSGAESQELEAQITSQVISRTPRRPEMYVETLKRLQIACHQIGGEEYPQLLEKALSVVLEKMSKFKPQPQIKKEHQLASNAEAREEDDSQTSRDAADTKAHSTNEATSTISESGVHTASQMPVVDEHVYDVKDVVQKRVRNCTAAELWDIFELYHRETSFEADLAMFDKVLNYKDQTRKVIEDSAGGVEAAVVHLFNHQLCPAFSAALIAQSLWDVVDRPGRDVKPFIKQLARCIDVSFPSISKEWMAIFRHLVLAMMQIYVASFVEATVILSEVSALHFAIFTVTIFATFVHLTRTASQAFENLAVMTNFLFTCFDQDTTNLNSILDSALVHYGYFCRNDQFKCMTSLSCSKHMVFPRSRAMGAPSERDRHSMARVESTTPQSQVCKSYEGSGGGSHLSNGSETALNEKRHNSAKVGLNLEVKAHYRSNEHPQRKRVHRTRMRDARLAECLRKAAILHESTARKALALLQLRADEYETQKLLPPTELVLAMDELLNIAEDDYHHPISPEKDTDHDKRSVHSRFAEHLDEPLSQQKKSMKTVLAIQNVFKMLRTGSLGAAYLNDFIDRMKELAMSGQFSSPVQFIDQHRANLVRIGKLPEPFAQALVRTQNEIYAELELPDMRFACETKRLKFLLAMTGECVPSPSALFRLATCWPKGFEEYYNIILDRFQEVEEKTVSELEGLWLQLRHIDTAGLLEQDSSLLIEFAGYAMQDWFRRPADITKIDVDNGRHQSPSFATGGIRITSSTESGCLPTSMESPAKHSEAVPRHLTDVASTVEPSTLTSTQSMNSVRSLATKDDTIDIQHASVTQSTPAPARTESTEESEITSKERTDPLLSEDKVLNGYRADNSLVSTDSYPLPGTLAQSMKSARPLATTQETNGHESPPTEYLTLPPGPKRTPPGPPTNKKPSSPRPSFTPTPSFRQLDMAKRLASLQANSRDLVETARGVTNSDHARVLDGLASKLSDFVAGLADSVDKLADLKGVQIAGFETPPATDA